MNERNVASGADSLYPRGRVWNMSNRDSRGESEYREKERERQKREREDNAAFAKRIDNSESAADAKRKHLQDLLDGGYHPDLGISSEVENLVARGALPRVEEPAFAPPAGYEGQSQRIRPHVIEDMSGATAVEANHLLQMLDRDVATKALKDLGLGDVNLPEKWDSMDVIHRARWLQDKQEIFSFQQVRMDDTKDLILPEIKGGSGDVPWDKPLVENLKRTRTNPEGGEREVSARENIARLLFLAGRGDESSADYIELKGNLDKHIESILNAGKDGSTLEKDYLLLSDLIKASEYFALRYESAGSGAVLEKFVSKSTREEMRRIQSKWNEQFRKEYTDNPDKYEELFKKLKEESAQVISIQDYGLYGRADEYRDSFDQVANEEISNAVSGQEREMLRWRKVVLQEGFDTHFSEKEILQPTADWRDSEKNLDQILRFLESTEFDDQQLSAKLGAAAKIVQGIPVDTLRGEDKVRGEEMQKRLTEKLQAIVAVNSFYSAMEHGDMNPEKVLGVFGHLKDSTFEIFFERFSKDSKGKELKYKDEDGNEKDLNILSVGMNVYMKRLNFERRVMNFVENWTKNPNLQPKFKDKELEAACGAAMHVIKAEMDKTSLKDSIAKWYRENTLLGAHDEHTKVLRKEEMVGNKKFKDGKAGDLDSHGVKVWEKGLVEELRDAKYGLGDERVQELVDSGTIDQVMNNAHRLSWMTAWSDYDGIRIWDPTAENPVSGGGRQVAFVYNGSTHMFHGRMVDHAWEFFVDESRGKVSKSNLVMQDELLGEHGNLLPQNRTMVRFARMLLGDKDTEDYVGQKRRGFKNIDKFDPNSKEEMGWAESAVLSEGIDSGELSFDNADWMSFFKTTSSWKYRWIDLYGDRKAMMDYMGAGVLQKYLQQPNTEMFFQINSLDNFYSKREVRLQPWMKLAIGAHQKIGDRWKEWWGLNDRMTHAEKEAVIEIAASTNRLDPKYKNSMKHSHLGWGGMPGVMPVRTFRQISEAADIFTREFATGVPKNSWRVPVAWGNAFFSQGMKYIFS